MPSIVEHMKQRAAEYANHLQATISNLDQQLADIEKQKAQVQAERHKASLALKRAADFPVKRGADYLCPICWVDDGRESRAKPERIFSVAIVVISRLLFETASAFSRFSSPSCRSSSRRVA
jgi:seryl-tRNA synthetase